MTLYPKEVKPDMQYDSPSMKLAFGKPFNVDPMLMKQMNLSLHRTDFINLTKENAEYDFVILTATDSRHYPGLYSLISTVHKFLPKQKVIIYDLGMTAEQKHELSAACYVSLRAVKFQQYPAHVTALYAFSWKIIIIHVSLMIITSSHIPFLVMVAFCLFVCLCQACI